MQKQNESTNSISNLAETELSSDQKTFIVSQQNFSAIINVLYNSYHLSENEVNNLNNSHHILGNEVDKIFNSDDKIWKELCNLNNSSHSLGNEVHKIFNSDDDSMVGVKQVLASTIQKMVGVINNIMPQHLTKTIDIAQIDPHKYIAGLRVEMLKCSNDSVNSAAIILKQLYQNPKQSHKTFMKLTGLSVDGMAKHVRMLKKRELVHRVGFQKYELTEKSLNILRGAMI
jgi:hypothetical protein